MGTDAVCAARASQCTELPPYSDALRAATGLPVYDAITCADFFIDSKADNPRFGIDSEVSTTGKASGDGQVAETIILLIISDVPAKTLAGRIDLEVVVQCIAVGAAQVILKSVLREPLWRAHQ